MNELTSSEFRKLYAGLREPTVVTVLGRPIGTWLPGSHGARAVRDGVGRPTGKELDRLVGYARQSGARGIPEVDAAIERGEKGTTTPFLEPAMRKARQQVIDATLGKVNRKKP